jgi:hypothetical protein
MIIIISRFCSAYLHGIDRSVNVQFFHQRHDIVAVGYNDIVYLLKHLFVTGHQAVDMPSSVVISVRDQEIIDLLIEEELHLILFDENFLQFTAEFMDIAIRVQGTENTSVKTILHRCENRFVFDHLIDGGQHLNPRDMP